MDRKTNEIWMKIAEEQLEKENCPLYKDRNNNIIYESYNGQVSSFGVSILMIGLKATLASYYQDAGRERKAYRNNLLQVFHGMLKNPESPCCKCKIYNYASLKDMLTAVFIGTDNCDRSLKIHFLNASIAMKQVIRTHKLG